jgi:hypothetical protein
MSQLFGDRLRDVGGRAWLRTFPDLLRTIPAQRVEAAMSRLGPGARVVGLALVVLAAAVASLGLGGPVTLIVAVAVVAIVATRVRLPAVLGDRAPLWNAVVQSWWAPIAGLLGLAMFVGGIATIFEAENIGGRIVGSTLLMAFGSAMLFGLMRRPFDRVVGNSLILLATVPALLFFWMIIPPVLAIVIWIGVLSGGFSDRPVVAAAH